MTTIQFLAEWALRSSILILSGALLLWALRVKDPSIRLAAWTAMLCGSLAIPALTAALPKLPLVVMRVAAPRVAAPTGRGPQVAPRTVPRHRLDAAPMARPRRRAIVSRRASTGRAPRLIDLRAGRPRATAAPVLRPGDEPAFATQQPGDRSGDGAELRFANRTAWRRR